MHFLYAVVALLVTIARSNGEEEVCVPESETTEFMLHKTVESLQKWMGAEIAVKVKKLTATVEHLNLVISKFEAQESSFALLQTTVTSLQAELTDYKHFVKEQTSFKATVEQELKVQSLIIKQQALTIHDFKYNLTTIASSLSHCSTECITDIKVSQFERQKLFNGPGFRDNGTHGYFLSGIHKINPQDDSPDYVYRRQILLKKKDKWNPIHE